MKNTKTAQNTKTAKAKAKAEAQAKVVVTPEETQNEETQIERTQEDFLDLFFEAEAVSIASVKSASNAVSAGKKADRFLGIPVCAKGKSELLPRWTGAKYRQCGSKAGDRHKIASFILKNTIKDAEGKAQIEEITYSLYGLITDERPTMQSLYKLFSNERTIDKKQMVLDPKPKHYISYVRELITTFKDNFVLVVEE